MLGPGISFNAAYSVRSFKHPRYEDKDGDTMVLGPQVFGRLEMRRNSHISTPNERQAKILAVYNLHI